MATWTTATRTWAAGETLTAANMNAQIRDFANAFGAFTTGSWTPTPTGSTTNPTLGTGSSQTGTYMQVQKFVVATFVITFGTSGTAAGAGTVYVSLPVTAKTAGTPIGSGVFWDAGGAGAYAAAYEVDSTTSRLRARLHGYGNLAQWTAPFTFAASDYLQGVVMYEAA